MKKITLFLLLLVSINLYSQNIIKEFVEDTKLSKEEMYSKTKIFIADKWENSKFAIQNADKDSGIIQVKTEKEISIKVGMGLSCIYTYEYMTKFRLKDGKYKIEIYDVNCISSEQVGLGKSNSIPAIPYFEGTEPAFKTKSSGKGISKDKAVSIMDELRGEFDTIISNYSQSINLDDDF